MLTIIIIGIIVLVLVLAALGGLVYWIYCLFWKDIEKTATALFVRFKKRAIRWVNKHIEENGKIIAENVISEIIDLLEDLKAEIRKINVIK